MISRRSERRLGEPGATTEKGLTAPRVVRTVRTTSCRWACLSAEGVPEASDSRSPRPTCNTRPVAKKHRLDEVYGVSRDLPINYVTRDGVDGVFVSSLARDKHIVVFGSSKQGKTSLRKSNLNDDDVIVVTCSNKWTLATLHSAILKAAGYTIEQSTTRTTEGTFKINAKVEGSAGIPLVAKGKAGVDGGYERKTKDEVTWVTLELDPEDVNDIISALEEISFDRFIVLEDFHYLSDEVQLDFAVALKAFHESSKFTFIIVGVWLDENRLIQFNGDLTERVLSVNADAWDPDQLSEVVRLGEDLLNIEFDPTFRAGLIKGCFESVSVVQTACHQVVEAQGISATVPERVVVGADVDPHALIRRSWTSSRPATTHSSRSSRAASRRPRCRCTSGCCCRCCWRRPTSLRPASPTATSRG